MKRRKRGGGGGGGSSSVCVGRRVQPLQVFV